MNLTVRPVRLGLFLALLSLSGTTTPVASEQVVSCGTSDDCPDETYCSIEGTCLDVGNCNEVADCNNPSNGPYPIALCLGTTICEQGSCGVDCNQIPPAETDADTVVDGVPCETNTDCPGGRDAEYCASDGICEKMGGCAVPDDCFNDANIGYPIAPCMGGMQCNSRRCEMDCSGGSDAIFTCQTTEDCREPETYCSTFGQCRRYGSCDVVDDCSAFDNVYPMIECVGRQYCEGSMCGIACGEMPINDPPAVTCGTSEDCDLDDYCAGNGLCLPPGACDRVDDCNNTDNIFMTIFCVGPMFCESGMCGKTCEEVAAQPPKCTTSDDCLEEEYCAGNGMCLSNGSCEQDDYCDNRDNMFMAPTCLGTLSCDAGMCYKACDSEPVKEDTTDGDEDGSPVVINKTSCTSDADCLTLATERSVTGWYCAQGVCMAPGSCQSDTDCFNPSNLIWNAKKCMGYLHCTDEGTCDTQCGEMCKDGSTAAVCVADPCDVEIMCEEAVSCRTDVCDRECSAVFFGAAGEVVECGDGGPFVNKNNPDANWETDAEFSEEASSATTTIRSVLPALLAAVLVAVVASADIV